MDRPLLRSVGASLPRCAAVVLIAFAAMTVPTAVFAQTSRVAQPAVIRADPEAFVASAVDARDVEVSRFGTYIAIYDTSEGNTIRVFDSELRPLWKERLRYFWAGSLEPGSIIQFAADESFVVFPGLRTTTDICVCDAATGEPIEFLREHRSDVRKLGLSPDGEWLLSASHDELILWQAEGRGFAPRAVVREFAPSVRSIEFAPDGEHVAVATTEGVTREVSLYTVAAGELKRVFRHAFNDNNISHDIDQLEFSPDGEWLAAGYRDTILTFSVGGAHTQPSGTIANIDVGTVFSLAFAPDGGSLVSGHLRFLKWWRRDADAWREVATTSTQQPPALDIEFSQDGRALYLASRADENALTRFSVDGVGPSMIGSLTDLLGTTLSLAQKRQLTPAVARVIADELGAGALAPRDMFETADEHRSRINVARAHLLRGLLDRIERSYASERIGAGSTHDVLVPLQSQGSYDVDSERYAIGALDTEGWLYLERDAARALFQEWQSARVRATRYERDGLPAYADFRLLHPSGSEYPLYIEYNPFTGERLDTAQTLIPSIAVGPDLEVRDLEIDGIFPTLHRRYETEPIGRLTVANTGTGIVSDLAVSFAIDGLTGTTNRVSLPVSLAAGQSIGASLVAPIGSSVLDLGEGTTATLSLAVSYRRLDQEHRAEISRQIRILNRNAIQWTDDRRVAAFVSVSHPTVVGWAGQTASAIRTQSAPILSRNLLYALQLFESLAAAGVSYVVDPNSAYEDLSEDSRAIDFVRFPSETLVHGAGDCDDLSVLYVALLEAVGVATAFITTPGHILVAFDTGIPVAQVPAVFHTPENLIVRDGTVWMPVETTVVDQGFTSAWRAGALEWRRASESGTAGFFTTQSAWRDYSPVSIGVTPGAPQPDITRTASGFQRELTSFRTLEFEPRLRQLRAQLADLAPEIQQNRLGVLHAQYGLFDAAAEHFERALAGGEYVPALINQANVLSLVGSHADARVYLERARGADPANARVLLGLAFSYWASGDQEEARSTYEDASRASPALARRFPLFVSVSGGGAANSRAGSADDQTASPFALDWADDR